MSRMFIIAILSVFYLSGCCTAYKTAVEKYAKTLPDRGKIYYTKVETPELKKELVLNDAALLCLIDKDKKKSTSEKPSAACKCADGLTDDWEANCSDFMPN